MFESDTDCGTGGELRSSVEIEIELELRPSWDEGGGDVVWELSGLHGLWVAQTVVWGRSSSPLFTHRSDRTGARPRRMRVRAGSCPVLSTARASSCEVTSEGFFIKRRNTERRVVALVAKVSLLRSEVSSSLTWGKGDKSVKIFVCYESKKLIEHRKCWMCKYFYLDMIKYYLYQRWLKQ